ncbi:MAG: hypothetical protein JWM04_474 [Verrucomicrobiales bacterium]|nr:hypothetical protein [Verrucomicrobiales bacterium]
MDPKILIQQIHQAFSGQCKPDYTLRVARGVDDKNYAWRKPN